MPAICREGKPADVIVQLSGRRPQDIAAALKRVGILILNTQLAGLRLAIDCEALIKRLMLLGLPHPVSGMAGVEQ